MQLLMKRNENRNSTEILQLVYNIISGSLNPNIHINSPCGRDGELFYSHILSLMYNMEYENFIICGDLNSRIGNMSDYINDVDNVAPREILDKYVNQHV